VRSELETLRAFALSRQTEFAEWLIDREKATPTITCDCCHGTVNEDESDGGICNDCYPVCSAFECRQR